MTETDWKALGHREAFAWGPAVCAGIYPRDLFNYAEGVIRWHSRVVGYAVTLVTDEYPPFTLA